MSIGAKKRITISDIARESGYSKTAVSFAFNAPERIGDEARAKIIETANRLNYVPDPRARNFSLGRQMTLGLLLPQDISTCLKNPYIVDVVRGIGEICQDHGYMLSLLPPINDSVYEAVKNAVVDGLIMMGYLVTDGLENLLDVRSLPLLMIDGGDDNAFLSVNINDEEASYLQLKKVLEKGHKKISIVSLPAPSLTLDFASGIVGRRLSGYRKALKEYNISDSDVYYYSDYETTYEDGLKVASLIAKTDSSCVVTMSDVQAYGIIAYFEKEGIRIPADRSVVGFDNIQDYRFSRALSTLSQPALEKGRLAASTMFDILSGKEVERAPEVSFSFIEGDTLGPAKN